jgi:hypothetical protein
MFETAGTRILAAILLCQCYLRVQLLFVKNTNVYNCNICQQNKQRQLFYFAKWK